MMAVEPDADWGISADVWRRIWDAVDDAAIAVYGRRGAPEPCECCDLVIGCGTAKMAEIRADDPVFAAYLDGNTDDAPGGWQ